MENRGRKRPEGVDQLPADKRACGSTEFRPGSSSSSVQTQIGSLNSVSEAPDLEMETTSSTTSVSGRSDGEVEKESPYGSCDSDGMDDTARHRNVRDYYHRRMSGEQDKFKGIVLSLKEDSGPSSQLAALTELCEVLSFCSEDSLPSLSSDLLGPVLVALAKQESNPDIMLLAIRAITYLCDVSSRSSGFLVRHDVVPALCARLMAIEYLDVAEQCLQALEKISRDHPQACFDAGAIAAILNYIDFFCTSIQRLAVSAVANICKKLPSDRSSHFMEAVPVLCNLLQHEDRKLVENVAICLIRIVERVNHSSEMLDELSKHGLIHQATQLVAFNSRTTPCQPVYSGLIGMLCRVASGSVAAVRTLLELNISRTLKHILSNYDLTHGMPYSVLGDAHCNQVHEFMKLLNVLLPPLPKNNEDASITSEREKILVDQPELLLQLGIDILPVLIQVVNSGASLHICYCCLYVINKLAYHSRSDMLIELLKDTNISSFLAGIFARKDHHLLVLVLKIVENLLQKIPDVFLNSCIKEGVLYAIDALLLPEKCSELTSPTSTQLSSCSNQRPAAKDVLRCLCYAFDVERSPSSEIGVCKLEKGCVCALAEHIKAAYFSSEPQNSDIGLTETIQQLRSYCALLSNEVQMSSYNDFCAQHEEILSHILGEIMTELNGREYMSTFEFIESGIINSLLTYLSNGHNLKERVDHHGSSNHFHVVLKRLGQFAMLFVSSAGQNWECMPLAVLIKKLQSALSSLEDFPVILSHASKPRGTYATIPVGRCTASPCLKVRIVREEDETSLHDYAVDVVTVEPFSYLSDLERFLWPKVSTDEAGAERTKPVGQSLEQPNDLPPQEPSGVRFPQDQNVIETPVMTSVPVEMQDDKANSAPSMHEGSVSTRQAIPSDAATTSRTTLACKELEKGGSTSYCNGDASPKLSFSLGGRQINRAFTLYQAIVQQKIKDEQNIVVGPRFWSEVYQITYRRATEQKQTDPQEPDSSACGNPGKFWQNVSFISRMLVSEHPCDLEKSDPTYEALFLLNILAGVNSFAFHLMSQERRYAFSQGENQDLENFAVTVPAVPETEFVNFKLTEKLEQQMRDPLIVSVGSMPNWCGQLMDAYPYLFGFEARCKYFRLATFGFPQVQPQSRLHSDSSNFVASNDRPLHSRSLPRKKFQVCRSNILESAAKMMDLHAHHKAILEVEYNEEVGSGLGPTMEFYTLVSHEFQKVGLGMWRGDYSSSISEGNLMVENSGLLAAPLGLFPRPLSNRTSSLDGIERSEVLKKFVLLGKVVAKAIRDGRVLDIPFSNAFYKLILEQELSVYDIASIDPELGRALLEFQALIDRKKYSDYVSANNLLSDLCYRNTKIEELWLDFTLPGYPEYMHSSGDEDRMVNLINLEEYVSFVVDATVNSGIVRQIEAFKSGFNQVFSIKSLKIFTETELEYLLCGERKAWTFNELLEHIKFDHGYTASSPPIVNLLEIIQDFGYDEQRAFLQFVTGAPRLPPGGLAALNPKLTIVRKHCDEGVDGDLPSVMTCANYLKLPPYSSKERMRERVMYAITEGQGSFHLS